MLHREPGNPEQSIKVTQLRDAIRAEQCIHHENQIDVHRLSARMRIVVVRAF
jgi:hypothetical protein